MGSDFHSDAALALRRVRTDAAGIEHVRQERHAAARAVAGTFARDAEDCVLLLDMLGLTPQDGLPTKGSTS